METIIINLLIDKLKIQQSVLISQLLKQHNIVVDSSSFDIFLRELMIYELSNNMTFNFLQTIKKYRISKEEIIEIEVFN